MKKRLLSLLLCAIMVCSAFASCSGASTNDDAAYRLLYSSEVSTLNYLVTSTIAEQVIGANTIDTLVEYDSDGKLKAGLATDWTYSESDKSWAFTIRSGAKWVDNTGAAVADVTAADFVAALKYVLTPEYESANVQNLFGVIKNAEEYYKGLVYKGGADDNGKTWAEISFDEVGVTAETRDGKDTLIYTLAKDVPYFLSSLVYVLYMPAYGAQLEELGKEFGVDNTKMYYCGAYYLETFEPQVQRILKKNELNYDAGNVFIKTVEQTYNAEASTLAPELVKRGELEYASIDADILDDWLATDETKNLVSKERPDTSYSYFYCFNFDPLFDAAYEPDNWRIAVNSENFRKSLMYALNRTNPVSISEPTNPGDYIMNTITPTTFAFNADGKDYSELDAFKTINAADSFNESEAAKYRDAAKTELAAKGVTFPVKVLMPYNPTSDNWDKECQVVEQQMEGLLGADYIDIIVEAGPSDSFLTLVRREGKYAFMKCGWGADYADPETWTDPFYQEEGSLGYKYAFLRQAITDNTDSAATVSEYFSLVEAAKAITVDTNARYDAFAKAEAYLIEHALAVPYGISIADYIATKLNVFEGQYAPFGVSIQRYKGQHLYSDFISMEQYEKNSK